MSSLKIKIYSLLSNKNKNYFSKYGIPKMHRQFLGQFLRIRNMWNVFVIFQVLIFTLHVENEKRKDFHKK